MAMDVSQLRTVIHVAELGSLSKAADRLHIAQPALSRQVRLLEEELGVRLFNRHGRGMVVTEAGQEVLRHAQRIMSELEEIRASVADEDAPLRGHVSIGMPPTVADILSIPLVSAFRASHPEATLRIVSAYSGYLLDWLHRGQVDVAILFETRPSRSLRSIHLLEEVLHLIGPRDADLSQADPIKFEELADRRLLLPSSGHGLRKIVEDCASEAGVHLKISVEADSYSTLKNLVKASQGYTILPLAPIHDEISEQRLSHAPLYAPVPVRRIMMSFPSDRPTPRLAKFAGQILQNTIQELVNRGAWAGNLPQESSRDLE
ncbi:LysR substrate-binding domain-containing protein [Ruegeria atlantica]|uniref:LysR substrate-binding domain-containing protein n=1 Tax=Ruegeria atlantica TaxID=81569 RepID=UPI001C2BA7AE|nr:LysR substrate-binding domain-containing protein [Ruegeria atlantica]